MGTNGDLSVSTYPQHLWESEPLLVNKSAPVLCTVETFTGTVYVVGSWSVTVHELQYLVRFKSPAVNEDESLVFG
jgi:hypothetical protein